MVYSFAGAAARHVPIKPNTLLGGPSATPCSQAAPLLKRSPAKRGASLHCSALNIGRSGAKGKASQKGKDKKDDKKRVDDSAATAEKAEEGKKEEKKAVDSAAAAEKEKVKGVEDSATKQAVESKETEADDDYEEEEEEDEMEEKKRGEAQQKIAIAQKIRLARELARKLATESEAMAKAAKMDDDDTDLSSSLEEKEERLKMLQEEAVTASEEAARMAASAAKSDTAVRELKKSSKSKDSMAKQLKKLREENEALKKFALEMASDKAEAAERLKKLAASASSTSREVEDAAAEAEIVKESLAKAEKAMEEANLPETLDKITSVVVGLNVAQKVIEDDRSRTAAITKQVQDAVASKTAFFCGLPGGMTVDGSSKMYYNRMAGPCPAGGSLVMKMGLNGWETLMEAELKPSPDLNKYAPGSDWYEAEVELSWDTFKVNFVVMSPETGTVDNNRARDYDLPLGANALTEEQVIAKRLAIYEEAEAQRLEIVEREEKRVYQEMMEKAKMDAEEAVTKLRATRDAEFKEAAQQAAAARRSDRLNNLRKETKRAGKFACDPAPQAGGIFKLFYNRAGSPMAGKHGAVLHLGYDGWFKEEKQEITMRSVPNSYAKDCGLDVGGDAQWYECSVEVPKDAAVLNFVFSCVEREHWDNGGGNDFHAPVEGATAMEELAERAYKQMRLERASEAEAADEGCRNMIISKFKRKAKAARQRRDRQREIIYTEPLFPMANEEVTLYYKSSGTVLRGRPEIWTRGSWNRYQHSEPWGPVKMIPEVAGVLRSESKVKIPGDAWTMDLVFSDTDSLHSGFYDNNNGLDYHIPVFGGSEQMRPLKVGGMGDVVTALGRAIQEEGHEITVILPKYDIINYALVENMREEPGFHWGGCQTKVFRGTVEGLEVVFLEPDNGNFWVGCIYGRNDDAQRFAFFNGIASEYIARSGMNPDIVHCHDWQTAPGVFNGGAGRKVFTIHNLNYGVDLIGKAMQACSVGTTVSPTYANEIGGNQAIAPNLDKLYGIINGIDAETWSPSQDRFLPMQYTSANAEQGKAAARKALRDRFGLSHVDVPVVGVVTRLTHQKGIHLIKHAAWRTLERGAQFVLLGSAPDPRVQAEFNALGEELSRKYPDRARLWFAFDEPLSHLMYAGSDMMLVPSMFEPCGLTQLISMSYGTVPVVRRTGGLNDSVFDMDHDEERAAWAGRTTNGFNFEGTDTAGMDYALNRALGLWYSDREAWNKLVKNDMEQDWSWNIPGMDYIELYYKALKD